MNPKIHTFQRRFLTFLGALIIVSLTMSALPGAGTVFAQSIETTPQPPVDPSGVQMGEPALLAPTVLPEEAWLDSPPPPEKYIQSVESEDPALGMIVYQDNIPAATRSILVNDNKAYFGDGSRLVIYNVTTPASPSYLGQSDVLAGPLMNLALRDSTAYLALGTSGVWQVDVSDPTVLPQEDVVFYTPGNAGKISLPSGKPKRIYVAAQSGHLIVLAPNRNSRQKIGVFPMGIASDVEAAGYYAYATDQYDNKLRIIDFSSTWKGKQVGSLAVAGELKGLTKSGNYVYIASGSQGLRIIDVSTPSSPVEVGSYSGITDAREVKISGNYAYVAAGASGLKILDVSTPTAPLLVASYDTPGLAVDVEISGSYVYIADSSSLVILQISGTNSIAGVVTNSSTGEGLANVTVSAANTATQFVYYAKTAAASGAYTIPALPAGSYTVTAAKSGYTMTSSFTNPVTIGPNATAKNFTAAIASDAHKVTGYIKDANTLPIANVVVTDGNGRSSITDKNGYYEIPGFTAGSYTITPTPGIYTFSPTSRSITIAAADLLNQNYVATPVTGAYKISGYVRNSSSDVLAGVVVSDGGSRSSTTNASGYYELTSLPAGSFTVGATKSGYTMTPSGWTNPVTILAANRTDIDFTYVESPGPYTITGTISDGSTTLSGVTVSASFGGSATSGSDGIYTITNTPAGSFTLSAAKSGYTCTPTLLSGSAPDDVAAKNFICTTGGAYSINGRITDGSSNPISGVTLLLSNGSSTTTNANGDFSFTGLSTGSYTILAYKAGYSFTPPYLTVYVSSEVSLDVTISFTGSVSSSGSYTVSGKITDGTNPVSGVSVYASNGISAVSSSSGDYTLSGFVTGSFAIMPSSSGYIFTPVTRSVSPSASTPAITGQDFVRSGGSGGSYTISGRVTEGSNPLAGVTVSDGTRTATTDSGGNYTINGVPSGSHTVTPTKSAYSFSPASLAVSVPPNATGKDFNAYSQPSYTISGRIVDSTGDPVPSVTITDGSGRTTSTDGNGNYTMTGVPSGVYTLTPSKSGYTFTPATQIGSVPPNAIDRDFVALPAPTYTVSGRVADYNGDPLADVTVLDKSGKMAVSDGNGNYTISGIPKGSYSLTASKSGYIFNPNPLVGSVPPNATKQNFTGMVGVPTPIPSVSPTGPTPTPGGTVYPGTYSISGTVRDNNGSLLSGVIITDGQGRQVTTDNYGTYLMSGYVSGSYNVTATRNGYSCSPYPQLITIPPSGTANFTCSLVYYAISGSVTDANNKGISGVTLSAGSGYTTTTDANGAYALSLTMGSYILTPSKTNFQFSPVSISLNVTANTGGYNFYGTSGVTDVVINGDFENDSAWSLPYHKAGYTTSEYGDLWAETMNIPLDQPTGSAEEEALRKEMAANYTTDEVLSGKRALRVGIVDATKNTGGYSEARQRVQVPWTSKLTKLRFWLFPTGGNPDSKDIQIVSLLDVNSKQKERLVTMRSNASKWQYYEFDLTKYRGQTLWIYFGVYNDSKNSVMGMYVDYVQMLCASGDYPPLPPSTPVLPTPTVNPGPTATPGPPGAYSISGRVITSLGAPLSGVTISTSDGRSAVTTSNGDYVFSSLAAGTYTLTPQLMAAVFTPPSSSVTLSVSNPSVSGLNFTSSTLTQTPGGSFSIGGIVKDIADTPIANVTITDGVGHTATSNASGGYTLSGLSAGTYSITSASIGYTFTPLSISVTLTTANVTSQNFTGTAVSGGSYTVSGKVVDSTSAVLAGVNVSAGDGHSATTDSLGAYTISGLTAGSYVITPSKSLYAFTPVSRTVTLSSLNNVTGIDFTGYSGNYPPYTVSGRITLGAVGLEGVSVSDGDGHTGSTNSNGEFSLSGFYAGSYTLTAAKEGYTFTANFTSPVVVTSGNVTGKDFIAATAPTARTNPDALKAYYIAATAKPRIDGDFPSSSTDFPSPSQWSANKNNVTYKVLGIDKIADQDMYGVWDLKAETLFGWDSQYLYVFARVYDNTYVQEADDYSFLYRGDSVDVGLDTEVSKDYTSQLLSTDDFRIGLSGGTHNPSNNDKKMFVYSPATKAGIPDWVLLAARPVCDVDSPYSCYQSGPPTNKYIDYSGYMLEAAIEWEHLGVTPKAGDHYGFVFSVSDNDQVSKQVQEKARATANNPHVFSDPTTWGDLELLP